MRRCVFLLLACLLAPVACSDDATEAADVGITPTDSGPTPKDEGPKKPDGPKKPPSWVLTKGSAPVIIDHRATALQDGRVLVTAGYFRETGKTDKPRADCYLFDPKTNTFKKTGSLKTARAQHGAVLLSDGRVLVFGGRQSTYKVLASAELFDPKKGTWSPAGSMNAPRTNAAVTLLSDGNVLAAGGVGPAVWQPHKTLEVYKPKSNSWAMLGLTLAQGRSLMTATALNSGIVIIAGGYDGKKWLDSVITFDPKAGTLALQKTKLGEARCAHTATRVSDGRVLLVGGTCGTACTLKGNEMYNPTTGQVSSISHSGPPPMGHRALRLADGRVLVTGGMAGKHQARVVAYAPAEGGTWTKLPDMKYARAGHTATLLPDGSVLVVGGQAKEMVLKAERLHNP